MRNKYIINKEIEMDDGTVLPKDTIVESFNLSDMGYRLVKYNGLYYSIPISELSKMKESNDMDSLDDSCINWEQRKFDIYIKFLNKYDEIGALQKADKCIEIYRSNLKYNHEKEINEKGKNRDL